MRNKSLIEKSFFRERFNAKYIELIEKCGVRLAVSHTMIQCLGCVLSNPSSVGFDPSRALTGSFVLGRVKIKN